MVLVSCYTIFVPDYDGRIRMTHFIFQLIGSSKGGALKLMEMSLDMMLCIWSFLTLSLGRGLPRLVVRRVWLMLILMLSIGTIW